jgi:hypothetical protein
VENHVLKALCFHKHGNADVLHDTDVLGPECDPAGVLASVRNSQRARSMLGLIQAEGLKSIVNRVMPLGGEEGLPGPGTPIGVWEDRAGAIIGPLGL